MGDANELHERRAQMKAMLVYKTVNKLAPQRLCDSFKNLNTLRVSLRLGFYSQLIIIWGSNMESDTGRSKKSGIF